MNTPIIQDDSPGQAAAASRGGGIAAVGLLLFMLVGVLSNGYAVLLDDLELVPHDATRDQILDGTTSRDIAANLANTPLPKESARLQRGGNWVVAGDLGPKVRQGCPGWLYLADELAVHPDGTTAAAARAATVLRIKDRLAKQNIQLVVAVVPDKSRIMAGQLCALTRPAALQDRAQAWVQALNQSGVTAIDLAQPLQASGEDMFLRTDTHWNERGAQLAAQATAAAVRAQAGKPLTPHQATVIHQGSAQPRPGDLARLAGIDWLPKSLQPQIESVAQSRFDKAAAGESPSAEGSKDSDDDLFGDSNLPTVALIGTSFSRTSQFADFLAHDLATPVASFAKDGGEFSGSASDYFDSKAFKQTPPKVIVWEIPERDLDAPLKKDKEIWP